MRGTVLCSPVRMSSKRFGKNRESLASKLNIKSRPDAIAADATWLKTEDCSDSKTSQRRDMRIGFGTTSSPNHSEGAKDKIDPL